MQPIAQMSERNVQYNNLPVSQKNLNKLPAHEQRTVSKSLTDGFGVVPSSQQQFRCSVPESDHDGVEIS